MQDIKIGTLVNGNGDVASYIKQISQHGFESYGITFWQTTEGFDWKMKAKELKSILAETGAVISL